jgi:imidazolonepropionase-like amidohydrolase
MAKHLRCGWLFTGLDDADPTDQTIVIGNDGLIHFVGETQAAPPLADADTVVDHSDCFVMPGLIEGHVHFVAGNAPTEEDVDIHPAPEFRALRTVINAQQLLTAGYTAVIDGGGSGRMALSVWNAINAGMFIGPRICCAGSFITTRQG